MQIRIILNCVKKKDHMLSEKSSAATADANPAPPAQQSAATGVPAVRRITSEALLNARREVEIEHAGKIYRLRVTQLNKLILTA